MASLTDQLNSPTAGKGIVNPGPAGPSWLAGLADFAGNAVQGAVSLKQDMDRESTRQAEAAAASSREARAQAGEARAVQEFEWKAQDRARGAAEEDVRNRTRQGILGIMLGDENSVDGQVIPEAARASIKEVMKAQQGVGQGRLSPTTVALLTEKFVSEMTQMFPDQVETIFKTAASEGMEHYMFRELNMNAKVEESAAAAQQKAEDEAYDYGVKWYGPGDRTERMAQGYALRSAHARLEQNRAEAGEIRQSVQFSDSQKDRQIAQIDREGVEAADNAAMVTMTGGLTTLAAAVASARTPEQFKMIQDSVPAYMANLTAHQDALRRQFAAGGASMPAREALDRRFAQDRQAVIDLTSGPSSHMQKQMNNLKLLTTEYGLTDAQAFRTLNRWKSVLGVDALSEGLGIGTLGASLSPAVKKIITGELAAAGTQENAEAAVTFHRVGELLRGETGLRQMGQAEAIRVVPFLGSVVTGDAPAVIAGDVEAAQRFSNAMGNLTEAAVSIQPSSSNLQSMVNAVGLLAHPNSTRAVEALIRNPATADEGRSLMMATRGATARILRSAQLSGPDAVPGKFQRLQWNASREKMEVYVDRAAYEKWKAAELAAWRNRVAKSNKEVPAPRIPDFSVFQRADAALLDKATVITAATRALGRTKLYDEAIPAGTSHADLLRHYALNKPLPGAKPDAPAVDADAQFRKSFGEWTEELQRGPYEINNSPDVAEANEQLRVGKLPEAVGAKIDAAAARHGVDPALARAVAWQESRGKQHRTSTAGAHGVMQLMPGTAGDLGVNIDDEDENIEGGVRYLAQMLKRYKGDRRKALAAYNAGPGRVDKAGGVPNIPETQNYVRTILGG